MIDSAGRTPNVSTEHNYRDSECNPSIEKLMVTWVLKVESKLNETINDVKNVSSQRDLLKAV